jgi:serine O-acetyltransferase
MAGDLELRAGSPERLARYVAHQLHSLFPEESSEADAAAVAPMTLAALDRMRPILRAVQIFNPAYFDHFHSLQYLLFLYFLSKEAFLRNKKVLADRLFCLNRSINAIDLYHQVDMGEIFFISHGLGTVVGNASFGNRLVLFQNVTIGRVGENRPAFGDRVILFPGSSVTGRSTIGDNCVIGNGARVHNMDVPDNTVVTQVSSDLSLQPLKKDYIGLYLRA